MLVFIVYHLYYANRVIPHVLYRNTDMTGKTVNDVADFVDGNLPSPGKVVLLVGDTYSVIVDPSDIGFKFLPIKTTQSIYNVGRSSNYINNIKTQIDGLYHPQIIEPQYTFDQDKAVNYLANVEYNAIDVVKEPEFIYENGELNIIDGKEGYTFDAKNLSQKIAEYMTGNKETNEIIVNLRKISPQLKLEDLDSVKPIVNNYVLGGLVLYYDDFVYELKPEEMLRLIKIEKNDDRVSVKANDVEIKNKLIEVASDIDRNPKGQSIEIDGDKVVSFVASEDGLKLKIKENTFNLASEINSILDEATDNSKGTNSQNSNDYTENDDKVTRKFELEVQVTEAPDSDNEFNIKDLIGEGHSKFKGSSRSRIHNVGLAASRVSGTLVPPGEIFSFNEAVGEISRKTGYTSAWVISKGRTVLGDGGGVCQVSTTMFRAALDAGLPIIERHAHSYRVSYYEQGSQPGIDATIYSPSVDLRFRNDTPGYILIMADFDGDEKTLSFKIYGTKDGRKVEMTKPKILSRTPPPEPLYINDPTLPKGKKVQVEHPVWGASVSFSRKVYDKDDNLMYDDIFKSNYRAWQAVYKVHE